MIRRFKIGNVNETRKDESEAERDAARGADTTLHFRSKRKKSSLSVAEVPHFSVGNKFRETASADLCVCVADDSERRLDSSGTRALRNFAFIFEKLSTRKGDKARERLGDKFQPSVSRRPRGEET